MRDVIALVVAILALITAVISLSTALASQRNLAGQEDQLVKQGIILTQQQAQLTDQEKKCKQLQALAITTALDITIQKPRADEMLPAVYNDMGGTFNGTIPFGYKLWVLVRDPTNYFLAYPPTQVVPTEQRWAQTNVRLPTPGSWELLICIGNEEASQWLQKRADNHDWSGFSKLPDGLEILRTQNVTRQ